MNRVERLVETPFLQLTVERKWRLKRTSVLIFLCWVTCTQLRWNSNLRSQLDWPNHRGWMSQLVPHLRNSSRAVTGREPDFANTLRYRKPTGGAANFLAVTGVRDQQVDATRLRIIRLTSSWRCVVSKCVSCDLCNSVSDVHTSLSPEAGSRYWWCCDAVLEQRIGRFARAL